MERNSIVCFGEILYDILPDGRQPGGAPMNVAYHLQKLEQKSKVISRIGDDELGQALLDFLKSIGLGTQTIQVDFQHTTSSVIASMNEEQEVSYEILSPVAWDYIAWRPEYKQELELSRAFVFGSLASRNEVSAETLLKMLDHADYKVFDVNLRAPHYSQSVIDRLLKQADLLKLNASELEMISKWYDADLSGEEHQIEYLFEHFGVKEILITKGAKGATYYDRYARYDTESFEVNVKDTIGSGDSFLAAFLASKLNGETSQQALNYAVCMGAFITSKSGACPAYDKHEFEKFFLQHTK